MRKAVFVFVIVMVTVAACSRDVAPPAPFGPCPTPRQLAWQRMEMNMFCHFGPNTFTGREWGDGQEAESLFNPTALDCRQWVAVADQAGMKGIIITAKHHDGFCLWLSRQSTHTVAQSPWQQGRGDVLRELREAIDAHGRMAMGVYVSPWDRNHPAYGTPAYNEVFANTLREVHEAYGPCFEQWFDGANGEGPDGKRQEYDWPLFNSIAEGYGCVIFSDVGPGCRWVGNENGAAGETCWSTLITEGFTPGAGAPPQDTLTTGNRPTLNSKLSTINSLSWVPAETDVSIRPGWFYHPNEHPKSVSELLQIYYTSVGRNSLLLLNVPPDERGLIPAEDSLRLVEFRAALDRIFSRDLAAGATITASHTRGQRPHRSSSRYSPQNVIDTAFESYWAVDDSVLTPVVTLAFPQPVTFNRVMLQEYIPLGQRVVAFSVEYQSPDGRWHPLTTGTTIGYKRILLTPTTTAAALRLSITSSLACPVLNRLALFLDEEGSCLGEANSR